MEEIPFSGNLAQTPFSHVLFRLRNKEKTGTLKILLPPDEKTIIFERGNLVVERESFPEQDFLASLTAGNLLAVSRLEDIENYARSQAVSLIRAAIEQGFFSPSVLWEQMTRFWKEQLYPLFDCSSGEYFFQPTPRFGECRVYALLPTIDFILQGVRRMSNLGLMEAALPAEDKVLQFLSPPLLDRMPLEPHENYLLKTINNEARLADIFAGSELGRRETLKVIFALYSLGIIGFAPPKPAGKSQSDSSPFDLERILSSFNDKCSYIFRYISKQIGPVAMNVLEKSLEEVKPRLGPLFQKAELRRDGRVEIRHILKMSLNLQQEENKKNLIRSLNEILMAEVLAVKKTLGNGSESLLVASLEKIGE